MTLPSSASSTRVATKTVAILQSNYIPWKGYFDLINLVDEFVLYDDMQYTRRDWRNRNRIQTANGTPWLSIPVEVKGRYLQRIRDTRVSDSGWAERHWRTLVHAYSRAPYFSMYAAQIEALYRGISTPWLSEINQRFLSEICLILEITTRLTSSSAYELVEGRTQRLASICSQAGGGHYVSGPAARDYIDPSVFTNLDLELSYMDYADYPVYPQLHQPFEHGVSILDLLFNAGPEAKRYMKSFAGTGALALRQAG